MRRHNTVMSLLRGSRVPPLKSRTIHISLIDALFEICSLDELNLANCEPYFRIFLRHGLLFPQREAKTLYWFVCFLYSDVESVRSVALRIARQLLAIGLFRTPNTHSNPELEWPRRCLYANHHIDFINCPICSEGHTL